MVKSKNQLQDIIKIKQNGMLPNLTQLKPNLTLTIYNYLQKTKNILKGSLIGLYKY